MIILFLLLLSLIIVILSVDEDRENRCSLCKSRLQKGYDKNSLLTVCVKGHRVFSDELSDG